MIERLKMAVTCKYAYQQALDDVRAFINREHENITKEKGNSSSGQPNWWRLTGEQDFILKFYDELGRLMSNKE